MAQFDYALESSARPVARPKDECRHGTHFTLDCIDCQILGMAATAKRAAGLRREQKRLNRVGNRQERALGVTKGQLEAISDQLSWVLRGAR